MIDKVSIPVALSGVEIEDSNDDINRLLREERPNSFAPGQVGDSIKVGDVFLKADSGQFGVITLARGGGGLEVIQAPVSVCCGAETFEEKRMREMRNRLDRIQNENIDDKIVDFIDEGLENFYSQDLSEGFSMAMGRDPNEKLSKLDKIMLQSLFEKALNRFLQRLDEKNCSMNEE